MANYELVFDLGSQYISAALKNDGFSDKIPSVVAYGGAEGHQIMAVGVDAIKLANTRGDVKLACPIYEGCVNDSEGAKALITTLLDRLVSRRLTAFSKCVVSCVSPCGMISSDKKNIEAIFLGLGAKSVSFVEAPIADSYALFDEFHARCGVIADIGRDCTDLAVVSDGQIVSGCTLYYAGKHLTDAIVDLIQQKYRIRLSYDDAEYLKLHCASLYPNDTTVVTVAGHNMQHNVRETVNVSSRELYDTLVEFAGKYVRVVQSLISSAPDNLSAMLRTEGVMLCGGGANLAGLDLYLQSQLGVPVRVAEQPDSVSIAGMIKK